MKVDVFFKDGKISSEKLDIDDCRVERITLMALSMKQAAIDCSDDYENKLPPSDFISAIVTVLKDCLGFYYKDTKERDEVYKEVISILENIRAQK